MSLFSPHKTDWDRGFESGVARGKIDSYPEIQNLLKEVELLKKKLKTSKNRIKKLTSLLKDK